MIQNIITDLVCIDCSANLMRNMADGGLFDTAKGVFGTRCEDSSTHLHRTERRLVAWFTVGSATAPVTSGPDDDFADFVNIPLVSAFTVDEEDAEAGLEFIYDSLTNHFGAGRWTNAGQGLRDDDSDTVGIDFDLNV